MKVVVDATTLDGGPSGAATRLAALARALPLVARRRGAALELLHLVRPGLDPLPGEACRPFGGSERPWGRARAGRRLDHLLREVGADLLHVGALPVPRVRACPMVLTLHDLRFLHATPGQGRLRRLWARLALPGNLERVAAVVAVSTHTEAGVVARLGLPEGRVHTIPNGPTPGLPDLVDPRVLAALRRRADLNRRYLLSLGPLAPHKRPGFLLEVLARLRAAEGGADVALAFAGRLDPPALAALARRAERAGLQDAVRVLGPLGSDELGALLGGADALVVAGTVEGFSIPVVDAQRLGVPVVAARAGALPEVAGEEEAWLASPDDPQAFAHAVLAALEPGPAREERLARAARRAARWSWERSAGELLDLWQALAATGGR